MVEDLCEPTVVHGMRARCPAQRFSRRGPIQRTTHARAPDNHDGSLSPCPMLGHTVVYSDLNLGPPITLVHRLTGSGEAQGDGAAAHAVAFVVSPPQPSCFRLTTTQTPWLSITQMKLTRVYTMTSRADGVAETRDRIARCGLQLFFENWYEDVTLAAIAHAAGVSHQTVLNHFESKEGVARAAADVLAQETRGRRHQATRGDVRSAVTTLVGEYELFGDANVRWAVAADRLGSLVSLLDEARAAHQEWLADIFADQLPSRPTLRQRAVNALHAATDVYTWKLLRRDLRLSRVETERTMIELVSGLVGRDWR